MRHTKRTDYTPEQLLYAAFKDQETDRSAAIRDGLFTYAEECRARRLRLGAIGVLNSATPAKIDGILKDTKSRCRKIKIPPAPPARALDQSTCWRVAIGSFVTWYMDSARARDNFHADTENGGSPVWLVSPSGEVEAYAGAMCHKCFGLGNDPIDCGEREVFEKSGGT